MAGLPKMLPSRRWGLLEVDALAGVGDVPVGHAKVPVGHAEVPVGHAEAPSAQAEPDDNDKDLDVAEKSLLQKILRKGLVENKNDLEIQRRNPNSPLHSVKSFEALNLPPNLLKGVFKMGFDFPSKIQETALPTLMAHPPVDMIAQSQSGTGKTAAFVLAMLSRVDGTKNYPQALCLAPTYELAVQIGDVTTRMGRFCPDIKIKLAVRGEDVGRTEKIEEQIVIGTPGKVLDWSTKFKILDMSQLAVFVLDEADVMIGMQGHQDQSIRIHKLVPETCQVMLFSATYDQDVMDFAEIIIPEHPIILRLKREEESLSNIKQLYVDCGSPESKYRAIANIYGVATIGQAMIFCHTRKAAAWLAAKLATDGHAVGILSGDLTIQQRVAVLERFRDGMEKVLITTNVLSRGIDVEQVTLVVNYDMPVNVSGRADCDTYLHRIGRTGRFGKAGLAINLVDGSKTMDIVRQIETHFARKIVKLDSDNLDELEQLFHEN